VTVVPAVIPEPSTVAPTLIVEASETETVVELVTVPVVTVMVPCV